MHSCSKKPSYMKHLMIIAALLTCSVCADAQQDTIHVRQATITILKDTIPARDTTAWDYIMMRDGQLLEVVRRSARHVTRDVVLVNETTIHPNGIINDSNGKTKQLKEGEYITMDGRIRNLNDMAEIEH